jgi:hypothetical protein
VLAVAVEQVPLDKMDKLLIVVQAVQAVLELGLMTLGYLPLLKV